MACRRVAAEARLHAAERSPRFGTDSLHSAGYDPAEDRGGCDEGCNTEVLQPCTRVGQVGHWRISLSHLYMQVRALTGQWDAWDTPYGTATSSGGQRGKLEAVSRC